MKLEKNKTKKFIHQHATRKQTATTKKLKAKTNATCGSKYGSRKEKTK